MEEPEEVLTGVYLVELHGSLFFGINWQSDVRTATATVPEPDFSTLALAAFALSLLRLRSPHFYVKRQRRLSS